MTMLRIETFRNHQCFDYLLSVLLPNVCLILNLHFAEVNLYRNVADGFLFAVVI